MTESRVTRRRLLQNTSATVAGATMAGTAMTTVLGQDHDHATPIPGATPSATGATQRGPQDGGYQFLGDGQAATIAAVADRLIGEDALGPGASQAGAVVYIDRALAGFYSANQVDYQRGLQALDNLSRTRFEQAFVDIAPEQQDELLSAMEEGTAEGFGMPSAQSFFELVRTHVMEGLLADPVYGGNRDFAGWRLVNFPGAVFLYTPEEMQSGQPLAKPFVSLADWFPREE